MCGFKCPFAERKPCAGFLLCRLLYKDGVNYNDRKNAMGVICAHQKQCVTTGKMENSDGARACFSSNIHEIRPKALPVLDDDFPEPIEGGDIPGDVPIPEEEITPEDPIPDPVEVPEDEPMPWDGELEEQPVPDEAVEEYPAETEREEVPEGEVHDPEVKTVSLKSRKKSI